MRMIRSIRQRLSFLPALAGGALVLAFSGTGAGAADDAKPEKSAAKTFEVEPVRDLAYYDGDDADKVKHKLDLYLPKGKKDFPVLFFVHGGAWMRGDKNYFGVYSALGNQFARHGVGAVVTNYRLSPGVKHPEHVKDVARAFAWTHQNIGKYGGKNDQVFACGHSAGGHLVSLLAADETYLKAEGLSAKDVKGVVPISGVYSLGDDLFVPVFGKDPEARKKAWPINHARPDLPPFLILYADGDLEGCGKKPSEAFCKALTDKKCPAEAVEISKRNHYSIIMSAAVDDDPVPRAVLDFINKHTSP